VTPWLYLPGGSPTWVGQERSLSRLRAFWPPRCRFTALELTGTVIPPGQLQTRASPRYYQQLYKGPASGGQRRSATSRTSTRRSAARSPRRRRPPGRTSPKCVKRSLPVDREDPATRRYRLNSPVPRQQHPSTPTDLRLRGNRPAFGGLHAGRPSISIPRTAKARDLGPNGACKTDALQRDLRRLPAEARARSSSSGETRSRALPSARAKLGMGRTYQEVAALSRPLGGRHLYLAVLGVRTGHLRPVVLRRDRELRERARDLARTVGSKAESGRSSDRSRTASSASSRSAWRAPSTLLMMLDEPASGLSRGERVA